MPLPPAIHPVIALSRHVLVLLEAEVTGLRNAHALRAAVTNIAGKNRVFTVLNRANRAGGLPTATIVKALGGKPDMIIPDLGKGMTQAVNLGVPALRHVPGLQTSPGADRPGDRGSRRRTQGMVEEDARAMKAFGKLERDSAPTRSAALDARRAIPRASATPAPLEKPVMSASLRERVIEQIEPSVAATVSREVLRRQIEEIIHGIANEERLELSGREQVQLADELADDMTGYRAAPSAPAGRFDQRRHGQRAQQRLRRATGQARAGRGPVPRQRPHRIGGAEDCRRASDGASTNPVRWWTAACRTAAASTSSSRRWRSTAPASPSANFRAVVMTSPE